MSDSMRSSSCSRQGLQNLIRLTAQRSLEDAEEAERERRRRARGAAPPPPHTLWEEELKPSGRLVLEEDEGFSDWSHKLENRREQEVQESCRVRENRPATHRWKPDPEEEKEEEKEESSRFQEASGRLPEKMCDRKKEVMSYSSTVFLANSQPADRTSYLMAGTMRPRGAASQAEQREEEAEEEEEEEEEALLQRQRRPEETQRRRKDPREEEEQEEELSFRQEQEEEGDFHLRREEEEEEEEHSQLPEEEENRRRSEEENRRRSEEENWRSEENRRRSEEENWRSEEENWKSEENRRRSEEENRRSKEENRRRSEEENRRSEEENRRSEEENRRSKEENRRRSEEENRRRSEEENRRSEEENRRRSEEENRRSEEENRRSEEENRRSKEENRRRSEEETNQSRSSTLSLCSPEGEEPLSCFGPMSPTFKDEVESRVSADGTCTITERTESLRKSTGSIKKIPPPVAVSKIDNRLEQYTQAIQISSKEAKAGRQALPELPSPTEPLATKKNLFEAGEAWNQNSIKVAPSKDAEGLKVGVAELISQWVKGSPDGSRNGSVSKPAEIKPGEVLNKKNLWENLGDTFCPGGEGKGSLSGKRYKFVVTGHGKYEKVPVDDDDGFGENTNYQSAGQFHEDL